MLRSVAETLIATCMNSPGSGALGGTAISKTIRTRKRNKYMDKRQTGRISFHYQPFHRDIFTEDPEMLEVAFPPTFEIALYLQPPFNGPADGTCSWEVVASHQGDVRQCPVSYDHIRPPERNLGANATLAENSTGPISSASPLNQVANYTSSAASGLPFKPNSASEPCIESSIGRLICPDSS